MADLHVVSVWALLTEARRLLQRYGWASRPGGAADMGDQYGGLSADGAVYAAAGLLDLETGELYDAVDGGDEPGAATFAQWRECRKAFRALCRAIGIDVTDHGDLARHRVGSWSDDAESRDVVLTALDLAIAATEQRAEVA